MSDTKLTQEQLDEKLLETQLNGLLAGATVSDMLEITKEQLEAGYSLAYNLYTAGNYEEAGTVFQGLCLYNHGDARFWMGLAGCRQAEGNLMAAIDAYSMAGLADNLNDPTPFIYAAICYVKLGKPEEAKGALEGALVLGDENNPQHMAIRQKGQVLLDSLTKGE